MGGNVYTKSTCMEPCRGLPRLPGIRLKHEPSISTHPAALLPGVCPLTVQGKEGVAKLFRLLKSEFGLDSIGKRQLALLFSLMDQQQPVSHQT